MSPQDAKKLLYAIELGLAIDEARAMFQAAEMAGERDVSKRIEEWMNAKLTEAKNA